MGFLRERYEDAIAGFWDWFLGFEWGGIFYVGGEVWRSVVRYDVDWIGLMWGADFSISLWFWMIYT